LKSVAVDFGVTQAVDANWGVHPGPEKGDFRWLRLRERLVPSPGSLQTDAADARPRWSARISGHRPCAGRSRCRRQARRNWGCERTPAIAGGLRAGIRGRIDHAVQGRDPGVVGPASHQIAEIDDEAAADRRDIHPLAGGFAHLEATGLVLGGEDRCARVRLPASASSPTIPRAPSASG
jgi:hypothetical protein